MISPVALGTQGPQRIWGHACPDCARAIEDRGAIGYAARAQGVVNFVNQTSPKKARLLRTEIEGDFPPLLAAWRALPNAKPRAQPWAHPRRVIDRL